MQALLSNDRNISVFTKTFSSTNENHSLIPASVKKIDSTTAQTRTWLKNIFVLLLLCEWRYSVVSFSFKTDHATGVCTVYVSDSVQTDCSWTLNRKILMKRAVSLPLLCFPQDIYQLCTAVCVGFTAYITGTTFIGFHFSTWVSRPSMKMKAEVEILFGPTFQELRSILVESKFKNHQGFWRQRSYLSKIPLTGMVLATSSSVAFGAN